MNQRLLVAILLAVSFAVNATGAPPDTTRKNTVRLNLTPFLLTGTFKSFTVGYERVMMPHFTLSANVGHLQLPRIINTKTNAPIQFTQSKENTGFLGSLDARFYIKRNRYAAPDGLYWGPYITYYQFNNQSDIDLRENNTVQGTGTLSADLKTTMVGVQLGYQFVVAKRFTIDFIFMGPGVGFYDANLTLDTDVQVDDNSEYIQGAYDAISKVFPGVATLLRDKEFSSDGRTSFTSAGFRYVLQIGYRF